MVIAPAYLTQSYPYINAFIGVTNAYPAVVTLFLQVNYVVDQLISFRCPQGYGMPQINNVTAKILVVNPVTNTVTIDLDTRGFDPFVFPGFSGQVPLTIPAGEMGTLDANFRNNLPREGYVVA